MHSLARRRLAVALQSVPCLCAHALKSSQRELPDLPNRAGPIHAWPRIAVPQRSAPGLKSSHRELRTNPYLAIPRLAEPHPSLPRQAVALLSLPCPATHLCPSLEVIERWAPCLALHFRARPCLAKPCLAAPRAAVAGQILIPPRSPLPSDRASKLRVQPSPVRAWPSQRVPQSQGLATQQRDGLRR
jgi:hypothetical protein